jgi:hypothetical protein
MIKKEEATSERGERWRRDKEATTKSFIDLQERYVSTDEAITKARLLEAEAKKKALEAEAEAKTKLLEAEAMLIAKDNKIMITDLETISDPVR